jgi:putative transcriptional regulator
MIKEYKSEAFAAIHKMADGMYAVGAITADKMKKFDEACLIQEPEAEPVEDVSTALLLG